MRFGLILLVIFLFKRPAFIKTSILKKLNTEYLEIVKATEYLLQAPAFWTVSKYHFNSTDILSVIVQSEDSIWNDKAFSLISMLHEKLNIPIIIYKQELNPVHAYAVPAYNFEHVMRKFSHVRSQIREYPAESSHSYLFISRSPEKTQTILSQGFKYPMTEWTPKDNCMILYILCKFCQGSVEPDLYRSLFSLLWKNYWILNVIIVAKYTDSYYDDRDLIVYTPFVEDECGSIRNVTLDQLTMLPKTYLERTWNLERYHVRVAMFNSFPNMIFKCKEQVCSYEGRDWKVLQNLAAYMNFTPVIEAMNERALGFKYQNGTFTGVMKKLVYKDADISGNERYIKDYGTNQIEFTMPAFYTKKLVVVVPKAQQIPSWKVISECFNVNFWLCLLAVFLSSAILWYMLRKLRGKVSYLANVFDMMAVFLTMSLNFLTKITSPSQRLLLSCCLFFSLIVMCLFQSSLLDVVAHPHYNREIETLAKLDESGLPIFTIDPNLLDTFNESEVMKNLAVRLAYRNTSPDTLLQEMIKYRNFSMLTSKGEALWYLGMYHSKLHIINDYPREYFVSYMIPKCSPYATRIHNLLGKMSEAGLVRKWDEDTTYSLHLEAVSQGKSDFIETKGTKIFKLIDFQLSFFVLGIGVTAGAIVLLLENCIGRDVRIYIVYD